MFKFIKNLLCKHTESEDYLYTDSMGGCWSKRCKQCKKDL
jgi:hypothetical protein